MDSSSIEREREFHDQAFADARRAKALDNVYAMHGSLFADFYRDVKAQCQPGIRVLDYGCGTGGHLAEMGLRDCRVMAIDISSTAIEMARTAAEAVGIKQAEFRVADAHALDVPDNQFDVVYGSGILHHLDLDRSLAEIRRVLKPGGNAFFIEPLGHNPVINWARRRTPDLRTPDEHPLLMADLALMRRHFGRLDVSYYCLLPLLSYPMRRTPLFQPAVTMLNAMDRVVFALLPFLRRHAWAVILRLQK